MNYDLDDKEGMANAVQWTQHLIDSLSTNGVWAVPRSGTILAFNKHEKRVRITDGPIPDPSLGRVLKHMGWQVVNVK